MDGIPVNREHRKLLTVGEDCLSYNGAWGGWDNFDGYGNLKVRVILTYSTAIPQGLCGTQGLCG